MDRSRRRDDPFIYNMNFVDFENEGITPPPQSYYRSNDWTSGKSNDRMPKSSREHWIQVSRIKGESIARSLFDEMVDRLRHTPIDEQTFRELAEEAIEQIIYQQEVYQ
jgi:hypothetical protein